MELEKIEEDKSNWGGPRAGAGRPKGVPNKMSRQVKENIVTVFEELGGAEEMKNWAKRDERNLTEFYRIYSRLAPIEQKVTGDPEAPLELRVGWQK